MEPFRVDVPDAVLDDLHARLKLARWADDFANEGWQYGTNTAYLKELVAVLSKKLEYAQARGKRTSWSTYLKAHGEVSPPLTSSRSKSSPCAAW